MLDEETDENKGRVIDLVVPIVILVFCCIIGMIYSGGFFSGAGFVEAFSNLDASIGLMLGSAFGLVFAFIYYLIRRSMSFKEMMACIPEGFKAMVPAILILTFAWTLKGMTDPWAPSFSSATFVRTSATGIQMLLPVIVFVIGCLLAFATGTSWGTFGILIPHRAERVLHGQPPGHHLHLCSAWPAPSAATTAPPSPTPPSWTPPAPNATTSVTYRRNCHMPYRARSLPESATWWLVCWQRRRAGHYRPACGHRHDAGIPVLMKSRQAKAA